MIRRLKEQPFPGEFRYMESLLDLTQEQKKLLLLNSVEAAFTSRNRKWKLKEQLLF